MNSFWQRIRSGERDAAIALAGIVLALYLIVISVGAIIGMSEIGKAPEYPMSIPVTGKGEVTAIPNIASFNYSVVESGKDVGEAQTKATTKNNAILDYLKSKGIEDKDIKTSGYNIYPKYEYNPTSGKQTLTGYEVNMSVTVKVRKADNAGEILSQVGTWGVSYVSGLTFTVDDEDALKRQARDMAIEDAKEQAKLLADKLGVKLGDIVSYYEMEDYSPYPMYESYAGYEKSVSQASVPVQIEAGEQKIVRQVSVSFEIKN
jgi:uncharacterized protein